MSELESRISDLGSRISNLGSRISDLESRISDLESRISNLGSRISDLRSRISDLGSRISNLGSRISNLGSRISNLGSRISNLESHCQVRSEKIDPLFTKKGDIQTYHHVKHCENIFGQQLSITGKWLKHFTFITGISYCWWIKSCTTWDVSKPCK